MTAEERTGAGTARPWLIANGPSWVDMVLIEGAEIDLAHIMIQAKFNKDSLTFDQWWDANLQETRVLVRRGVAADHGGVTHLPDGGTLVVYPDGRRTF